VRDSNGAYLASSLATAGLVVSHILFAPDDFDTLVGDLRFLLEDEPEVLVVSGGLGTTHDDMTAAAIAAAVGKSLRRQPTAVRFVEQRLRETARRRGLDAAALREQALRQARLPVGSRALPPAGLAPGFALRHGRTRLYAFPGVPTELSEMWPPVLEEILAADIVPPRGRRLLRLYGVGEMELVPLLARRVTDLLDVSVTAADGEITVALTYPRTNAAQAQADALVLALEAALPVFSSYGQTVDELIADALRSRGQTVAVAESCTGGLLGGRFTEMAGSSDYFLGGVIAYANSVKEAALGVPSDVLASQGAVSEPVAAAMARGARAATGASFALSTTGIAGPGGATPTKPVGLVYIACAAETGVTVRRHEFPGNRQAVRQRAVVAALHLLRETLEGRNTSP